MKISLVLPVYNESPILDTVLERYIADLKSICESYDCTYEVIAVNDGSDDASEDILKKHAKLCRKVRIVNLDGRHGKQSAVTAGFDVATGDVVIMADVDLLNPGGILAHMFESFVDGHQIVYGYREKLGGEALRLGISTSLARTAAKVFRMEGEYIGKSNIQMFSRDVMDVIVALPNKNRYLRTMDNWTGWSVHPVNYASAYNKTEIREEMRRRNDETFCRRDNTRAHTPSKIYATCFLLTALLAAAAGIIFLAVPQISLGFPFHLMTWLLAFCLLATSVMYFARGTLIKRIGVIHTNEKSEIYRVRNIVN